MRTRSLLAGFAVVLSVLSRPPDAQAALVTISTSQKELRPGVRNQGWVSSSRGNTNPLNDNYATGYPDTFSGGSSGDYLHSYFFFDLSSVVAGSIEAAELRLTRGDGQGTSGLVLSHVAATAAELISTRGAPKTNPAIFADLADGPIYGAFTSVGLDAAFFDVLSFPLNETAISFMNLKAGTPSYFALGAAVVDGYLFAFTNNIGTQELVLTISDPPAVPEGRTLALLLVALSATGWMRLRAHDIEAVSDT